MDYTGSTQLSSVFSVNTLKQDGLASGTLTGIAVDNSGVISANFSNGSSTPLGQVALTLFTNPQGLTKLGGTNWGQSSASGAPISGTAGAGQFGHIQSGSLEQSNVSLSQELVNLISAQQAYQANSQSISTENKVIETIMNAFR
jgi:flagellar hook protein FlgE